MLPMKIRVQITLLTLTLILSNCDNYQVDGLYTSFRQVELKDLGTSARQQVENQSGQMTDKIIYEVLFLQLLGDTAYLDSKALSVGDSDTLFITDDGICHYYSGTIKKTENQIDINVHEVVVNNFEAAMRFDSTGFHVYPRCHKDFSGTFKNGQIITDNHTFRKSTWNRNLTSRHPELYKERVW